MNKLQKALMQLEEKDLTHDVIIPLIRKLHPGRIEYTHSANEAGRDIVSFGKDSLKRQHILCIQIKANKVSYGAQFQGIVVNPTRMAKVEGVTTENGSKSIPNEIWFITSTPFPEQQRRQVSETLKDLEKNGIKFIPGEELCDLITDNLPDLANELCKYSDKEIVNFLSDLSRHKEGIAFEMDFERNISEFYISASFSPHFVNSYLLNNSENMILDYSISYERRISEYFLDDDAVLKFDRFSTIIDKEKNIIDSSKFQIYFKVNYSLEIVSIYKRSKGSTPKALSSDYICKNISTIDGLDDIFVKFNKVIYLCEYYKTLKCKTSNYVAKCPRILTKKCDAVIETYNLLKKLDLFIYYVAREYKKSLNLSNQEQFDKPIELKIQIQKPQYLLGLGTTVFVEGQPGCGKTTLLKKLAMSLLEQKIKVKFVSCCSIAKSSKKGSLESIIDKFAIGKYHQKYNNNECIIILDGLDESPFDLSNKIIKESNKYLNIVASSRTAYNSIVRDNSFNITLAPFSTNERNLFFDKIFCNDNLKSDMCRNLFTTYPDIDNHSRIPLIASITATLINSGYTPTTRSEIYNYRLDLLLSKWDRVRGVSRIKIDNPKAKIRFLRNLAFRMHSFETRNRFINLPDLREAYENSLGGWGYEFDFQVFIQDLVLGSGILLEAGDNKYSFGHLSFQEHLAGEYLSKNSSIKDIYNLLGDDWWREPLNFWASKKGSITEFLDKMLETTDYLSFTEQLLEMVRYAPYTSAGIVEILNDCKISRRKRLID